MEPIYIKKTKLGRGVFASRDIKKGENICRMAGKKISAEQLGKISKDGRNILVDPLQVSDRTFINMRKPYVLVNHSCEPNAGIIKRDVLVALRNIRKGEEILYDYSSVWYEGFRCECGSTTCRKFIGDFFTLPKPTQKKYMKLGIVPEFIKKIKSKHH